MRRSRWTIGERTTPAAMRVFANLYVWLFGRKLFYGWNQRVFNVAVRGMGVGNPTDDLIGLSEDRFLRRLAAVGELTVFDVGAHLGDYAAHLLQLSPAARIWCFEPHPATFKRLSAVAERAGFTAVRVGLSDAPGRVALYDYAATTESGSSHATLHADVIERIHHGSAIAIEVDVTTVDLYMESEGISHLSLLKVDAEGHELAVLRGAQSAITSGKVDIVQFEFNEMNVVSRVFFKDFYEALPGFSFFRMVTDGLAPVGAYRPRTHELFVLQNVIAIRNDFEHRATLV